MEKLGWQEALPAVLLPAMNVTGHFVRRIKDPSTKKWISTFLGFTAMAALCDWGILHLLVLTVGNALIVLHVDKRYIHCASLFFSYLHLTIYHLEHHTTWLPVSPVYLFTVFNFFMMRIVNLALNVQEAHSLKDKGKLDERNKVYLELTFTEICHFAFSYLGTINIFRYRTYYDWLHCPLASEKDCRKASRLVVWRFVRLGVVTGPILLMFPLELIRTERFYHEPFAYRLLYSVVVGLAGRLLMYSVVSNGELGCTMAGLGAYPAKTKPRSGDGPTENLPLLEQLANHPDKVEHEELSFEAVRGVNAFDAELLPTLRTYWRDYNSTLQYYYVANVYRRFPIKSLRLFVVFLLSAWCHRFEGGFFISLCYTALYIPAEDLWYRLYMKHATGTSAKVWYLVFWLSRLLALTFISVASYLESFEFVYRYTASIYFFPVIFPLVMYTVGALIASGRKKTD